MSDRAGDIYSQVHVDEPRNENLDGQKSSRVFEEEAALAKRSTEQRAIPSDREPDEVKSTARLLPEDAKLKSKHSSEQSSA